MEDTKKTAGRKSASGASMSKYDVGNKAKTSS